MQKKKSWHTPKNSANNHLNNSKKYNLDYLVGVIFITLASTLAIFLAFKANTDLTEGRHVLFMDERITFDGVREIIRPESFISFTDNIIDGKDHRYGRILWNISALFSFLPERIWGVSGQIMGTRSTHSMIQIIAYFMLTFAFIKSWTLRGIGLLALTVLPYSAYFATMPKPEPIQLLFLSLFLALSATRNFKFG